MDKHKLEKWEFKIIARSSDEQGRIIKIVNGALQSAINDHGPITSENYHSASKRVIRTLVGYKAQNNRKERARILKHRAHMLFE